MHELGWTSREWLSTLPEENEILIRCVARYHAFMDLLSTSFSLFAVPTLDIVSIPISILLTFRFEFEELTARSPSINRTSLGTLIS